IRDYKVTGVQTCALPIYLLLPVDLQEQIDRLDEEWRDTRDNAKIEVGEDEVAYIVQSWTGIPVTRLVEAETTKLLKMEDAMHNQIGRASCKEKDEMSEAL